MKLCTAPGMVSAIVAMAGFLHAFGLGQLPEGTVLHIGPGGAGDIAKVKLSDPGNHQWIIESSDDAMVWIDVAAWKVHNGLFRLAVPGQPVAPQRFFRARLNPWGTTLPSTLDTALRAPGQVFNYGNPTLPGHIAALNFQNNTPSTNLTTDAGARLGRVLFHDKRLSLNFTVSCASCHQASHGFSDPRRFSIGFAGQATPRNSMGLSSARYYARKRFFWDERAATLEDLILLPIQNPIEMGLTLPELVQRLSSEPFYVDLFSGAFGSPDVTTDRIARALAQFIRSIISTQTKFDQGRGIGFSNFTAQEQQGRSLFGGLCGRCHSTDNFVAPVVFNNGLEFPFVDRGIGAITGQSRDDGKFKASSLRNIELTAPYMHDGRFATLEEVVEFYSTGIVANPNLDPGLGSPISPRRFNFSPIQKAALVAFLKTLTDFALTTDEKFSDPFNYGD